MDIQLLLAHIGESKVWSKTDNITDVPKSALDALAHGHEDESHDAADDGGDDEDPEPVRPADDGAHRGHQFDVARAHGAQRIKSQIAAECNGKPDERIAKARPALIEEAVQGEIPIHSCTK